MTSDRSYRLPIFQDDLTFQDRHEKSFRDLNQRIGDDMPHTGFGRDWPKWHWEDELDKLCGDFFELKPRGTRTSDLKRDADLGSRESLDDHSMKNVFVENPQTKSRTFHMSFDVKDYSPSDITVKTDGGTLVVEARHEDKVGDHTNVREFSRNVKIPPDVDADKLTSTMSNDGILTIQAPVPPKYTSVAYVNQNEPAVQSPKVVGNSYNSHGASNIAPAGPAYSTTRTHSPLNHGVTSPASAGSPYTAPGNHTAAATAAANHQTPSQPSGMLYHIPGHAMPNHGPQPAPPQYQYPQYSNPAQPQPSAAQYAQHQPQSRPSPPPQRQYQSPPPSAQQPAWPAPPPPHHEPSPPLANSPPPLFAQPVPPPMPLDKPFFKNGSNGGPREMELALEVPRPFTPDDVVVKLEGKTLNVEATHEEKAQGKTSKSSMSRSFDLDEDLDPSSVEAMLRSDGCLLIKGKVLT